MTQASAQAHAFYRAVAKTGVLWTVCDDLGFPRPENPSGYRAQPFWSSLSRVQKIIKNVPAYGVFEPHEMIWADFVAKWVPGLTEDGVKVGVNWSGKRALGYDLDPADVVLNVSHYLTDPAATKKKATKKKR